MSKPNVEWLSRTLLVAPYCFALCLTEEQFDSELRRLKIPANKRPDFQVHANSDAAVFFFHQSNSNGLCALVCMSKPKRGKPIEVVHGLLVHEAVHIWQACRDELSEKNPSSEMEAYAIQHIAQELMASYRKQTQPKRRVTR